ncbi:MAG: hypothetical protein QXD89_02320 [Candidatus Aenigmatarchaeota archaeon]
MDETHIKMASKTVNEYGEELIYCLELFQNKTMEKILEYTSKFFFFLGKILGSNKNNRKEETDSVLHLLRKLTAINENLREIYDINPSSVGELIKSNIYDFRILRRVEDRTLKIISKEDFYSPTNVKQLYDIYNKYRNILEELEKKVENFYEKCKKEWEELCGLLYF